MAANFAAPVASPKSNFGDLIALEPSAPLRNVTCLASCLATVSANVFRGALEPNAAFATASL